jgi:hypothetical protein
MEAGRNAHGGEHYVFRNNPCCYFFTFFPHDAQGSVSHEIFLFKKKKKPRLV